MSKILFEIEVRNAGAAQEVERLKGNLRDINKELKGVDAGTKAYESLTDEAIKTRIEIKRLQDQQKALNNEFKQLSVPKDSLQGMRNEYAALSRQIALLTAQERGSKFGQSLIAQAAGIKKQVDGIEQSFGRFTGNVGNYRSAIDGIGAGLGKAFAVFGIANIGDRIIETTRQTERLFAVLQNAVGSNSAANSIFSQIRDFATTTPFQVNELVEAFVKLEQRNFNPTIGQLKVLGDIAVSQNKSINQFVEALLDAQTGEFERLKEFGIVVRKSKTDTDSLSVSFKGQATTIKNTSESISQYLLSLGNVPGIAGAANAVSKTLDGSISNLSDNFDQLITNLGQGGGALKGVVDLIGRFVGFLNEATRTNFSDTLREQQQEFNALISIVKDVNTEEGVRKQAIAELNQNYGQYIGNINLEKASQDELNAVLKAGNDLFLKRIFVQAQEEELAEFAQRRLRLTTSLLEAEKDLRAEEAKRDPNRIDVSGGLTGFNAADQARQRVAALRNEIESVNEQTKEFAKDQEELAKALGLTAAEQQKVRDGLNARPTTDKKPKGPTTDVKKEADAAAGSLEFLREKVKKLQEQLEKAAPDKIAPILQNLIKAEAELKRLEDRIEGIRNPAAGEAAPSDSELDAVARLLGSVYEKTVELSDQARESIVENNAKVVEDDEYTAEQRLALERALADKKIGLTKEEQEEKTEIEKEEQKKRDEILKASIQGAAQLLSGLNQIRSNQFEQELEKEEAALDARYEKELEAVQGNAVAEEAVRKKFEAEKLKLEKKAAEERRKIARTEIIINTAVAIAQALPNVVAAAAAAAAGAIQLAVVNSQKFEKGGKVQFGMFGGQPHSAGGTKGIFSDGTRVEVEKDEAFFVLNKRASAQIAKLSALNQMHGGRRFADGGALAFTPQLSNFAPAASQGAISINVQMSDEQMRIFAQTVAGDVAKETANATRTAVGEGLNDANRRTERQARANETRQV